MARSAHTATRTNSATAPISLRMRMDMRRFTCVAASAAALYGPRRHDQACRTIRRMRPVPSSPELRRRVVRLWLMAAAACVLATLIIGGATRLTESGLSIVEWKPVAGTLPPLSDAAWQAEFEKYQAIPQYRIVNRGMTLGE